MNLETITIKEYLTRKGVHFTQTGKELTVKCLFNDCDSDSKGNEAHLYFEAETGQYECKKCGEKGNIVTLAKHFGDDISEIALKPLSPPRESTKFDASQVESCHQAMPDRIREYLVARGITGAVIEQFMLGWGKFYGQWWITIPIPDADGTFCFFKLRQDPNIGNEKITYPKGIEAQIYGWDVLKNETDKLVICEGELDSLALLSQDVPAVTSTHGAMTFKQVWAEKFGKVRDVYICYDNDDAGRKGAERVAKILESGNSDTHIVSLPEDVGVGGDVTDYLTKLKASPNDLFDRYAREYPEKIDTSQFKPISTEKLAETLGLTIKQDKQNKIVTFLCELSAYTENAQFNISYNAPSSTGKSYIPLEISNLFPKEDVMKLGNCSPTAFFHEQGEYDKENNTITVDLSRKIIIFLDQPHNALLERLRSLFSHDEKEMQSKITDKNQKGGNRTKTVIIKGFPSAIFCSAGLRIDEQEATRFLLLSPEVNQEKLRNGITQAIAKESDNGSYKAWLNGNPERILLKNRIQAIKQEKIKEIKISNSEMIEGRFLGKNKVLKPRHQRDIKRLLSIIKSLALLNVWWREKSDLTITANKDDIDEGFSIWEKLSASQELNLPPYVYNLYREVILELWEEKNGSRSKTFEDITGNLGITRQEILDKHYQAYGRMLDNNQLRQQILPMLETAGLIIQEQDINDKRKVLVFPTLQDEKNNSELEGGVNENTIDQILNGGL